jgi:hypothetical protein
MNYPEKDNRLYDILEEISSIHSLPYKNFLTSVSRQWKLDKLHSELDGMNYHGERPARNISLSRNTAPKLKDNPN